MMNVGGHARVVVDEENKNIKGEVGKIVKYNPIKDSCLLDFGAYQDDIKRENLEILKGEKQTGNYEQLGKEIGQLVDEKNEAYGDSFAVSGEFLKLLYPDGIDVEDYTDALCLVRIFDKCKRIATQKEAFDESPYRDIAGYGLLGAMKDSDSND